jgi:hypothetical protein
VDIPQIRIEVMDRESINLVGKTGTDLFIRIRYGNACLLLKRQSVSQFQHQHGEITRSVVSQ